MAGKKVTLSAVKTQDASPSFGLGLYSPAERRRNRALNRRLNRRLAALTKPAKLTIEYAFSPHLLLDPIGSTAEKLRDIERDLRAVSLLIFHATDGGNDSMDGNAALGLSRVVDACAGQLANIRDLQVRAEKREQILDADRRRAEAKRDRVKRKVA